MDPTRISGNDRVSSVGLRNKVTGEERNIAAEAVVIRIGVEPNTEFLRGQIDLDAGGYVRVNSACETSVGGVYAVGDAANREAPTVSAAIGMGAISVKAVYSWLNR
jgi:thioredoxin reductase